MGDPSPGLIQTERRQSSISRRGGLAPRSLVLLALLPLAVGCTQGGQTFPAPPSSRATSSYALVYEDNFATDPANAGGELQNIKGSSSNPQRPDWQYRSPSTVSYGCTLGTSANVFLSKTAGDVPGLVLSDIASNPQPTNAKFPSGPNQAYQNYTCGGLISTRRFGYGYYETYGSLNVSTPGLGFHTSFWTYNANPGGYHADEADIFEDESIDNGTGKGFSQGIFGWNVKAGAQNPSHHPYDPWSAASGGFASPHTWGVLISPTMYQFYVDGANMPAATAVTAGPYVASEVEFSSVGSVNGYDPFSSAATPVGPWIQFDGSNTTKAFHYSFQYFKYYQETDPQILRALALPAGSIFIDTTAQAAGSTGSSFTPGKFGPYLTYPYAGAINPNLVYGPQGYRGQNAYTSAMAGDTASWSHTFSAADAGSYDVFVWNAAAGAYQLPGTTGNVFAPDAASNTRYVVNGSVGPAAASQIISQADSGQQWVALNSTGATVYPTNTYAFTAGSTGKVVLTVGSESSIATDGKTAFTPHTDADSVAFVPVSTFGTTNAADYADNGFSSSSLAGWAGSPATRSSTAANAQAQWTVPLPSAGTYTAYVWSPADGNTTHYAYYTVKDGSTPLGSVSVDQSLYGSQWVPLGTFTWAANAATVTVQNGNGSEHPASGTLETNSLKLVPQVPVDYVVCTSSTGIYGASLYSIAGSWALGTHGYSGCGNVDQVTASNGATATFYPQVPVAGMYHAYLYADPALSSSAQVTVQSHSSVTAGCDSLSTNGGSPWIYLGDYFFGPDSYPSESNTRLLIDDSITVASTGGSVGVSAIKLSYSSGIGNASSICSNEGESISRNASPRINLGRRIATRQR